MRRFPPLSDRYRSIISSVRTSIPLFRNSSKGNWMYDVQTVLAVHPRCFSVKASGSSSGAHRASQRHANPHWNRPIRHRYFLGLCVLTGLAGAAAGHWIPIDETAVQRRLQEQQAHDDGSCTAETTQHPPLPKVADLFDRDAIQQELQGVFDFRPDMAACFLQLAFIHTMNRARTLSTIDSTPPGSSSFSGAVSIDAHALLSSIALRNSISYADALTLAVVSAVHYLSRGSIQLPWRCGRVDGESPFAHLDVEPLRDAIPKGISVPTRLVEESGFDSLREWSQVFTAMGFSMEEFVALLGVHSVGSISHHAPAHTMQWTKDPYSLNNAYYRMLTHHVYKPISYGTHKGVYMACGDEAVRSNLACLSLEAALVQDPRMRPIVDRFAKDEQDWLRVLPRALVKLTEFGYGTVEDWSRFEDAGAKVRSREETNATQTPSFLAWLRSTAGNIVRKQQQVPRSHLHTYVPRQNGAQA